MSNHTTNDHSCLITILLKDDNQKLLKYLLNSEEHLKNFYSIAKPILSDRILNSIVNNLADIVGTLSTLYNEPEDVLKQLSYLTKRYNLFCGKQAKFSLAEFNQVLKLQPQSNCGDAIAKTVFGIPNTVEKARETVLSSDTPEQEFIAAMKICLDEYKKKQLKQNREKSEYDSNQRLKNEAIADMPRRYLNF